MDTTQLREKAGDGTTDHLIEIRQSDLTRLLDELRTVEWYAAGCPPQPGQQTYYPEFANLRFVRKSQ